MVKAECETGGLMQDLIYLADFQLARVGQGSPDQ
jgi:hypothetical protein